MHLAGSSHLLREFLSPACRIVPAHCATTGREAFLPVCGPWAQQFRGVTCWAGFLLSSGTAPECLPSSGRAVSPSCTAGRGPPAA